MNSSLLQTIAAASSECWIAFDRSHNIVLWNRALEIASHTRASDCLGKGLFSPFSDSASHFLSQTLEADKVSAVLAGQHGLAVDRQVKSKFGPTKIFELRYTPWFNTDHSVLGGFVSLHQQMALSKTTGTPGASSDKRFRIMADCSPVMLWLAGIDARCVFFNQTWLDFSGNKMEDELDFGWARGIHHEDFQSSVDAYLQAFNRRQEFVIEYRLKRHDGHYRWILDSAKPFWNIKGGFAGYIGSCIDITALKKSHELTLSNLKLNTEVKEQKKAALALQAANQDLEDFAHTISHDLQAPLRGIRSFGALLYEEHHQKLDDSGKKHLNYIQSCALEMQALIHNLLDFARTNNQSIEKRQVNLKKMVEHILEGFALRQQFKKTTAVVAADLPDCFADSTLIKQVFSNLIDNAFKYSQHAREARIEIGWLDNEKGVCYFIKDNGIGFEMDKANKLFGLFQRLPTEKKFDGTGLGLAIVARIITRHGGKIWVQAQPGQGATFFFNLGGLKKEAEKRMVRDAATQ